MKTYKATRKVKEITSSKKSKFYLSLAEKVTRNTGSSWDGGSRYYYSIKNFKTGATKIPSCGVFPTFNAESTLENDEIFIITGISCGKPATPQIIGITSQEAEILSFLGNPEFISKSW